MSHLKCTCGAVPFNGQRYGDLKDFCHIFGYSESEARYIFRTRPAWIRPYLFRDPPTKPGAKRGKRLRVFLPGIEKAIRSNRVGA